MRRFPESVGLAMPENMLWAFAEVDDRSLLS